MHNTDLHKRINALGIRRVPIKVKSRRRTLETSQVALVWSVRMFVGVVVGAVVADARRTQKKYDKFTEKETINIKLYTLRILPRF